MRIRHIYLNVIEKRQCCKEKNVIDLLFKLRRNYGSRMLVQTKGKYQHGRKNSNNY